MAHVTIQIQGIAIQPDSLPDPQKAQLLRDIQARLQHKLDGIRCAEHELEPHVTVNLTGTQQHIAIAGCCQSITDVTANALQVPPPLAR